MAPASRSDSLKDLSLAEVSFTSCSILCLVLCLPKITCRKTQHSDNIETKNSEEEKKRKSKITERACVSVCVCNVTVQLLTVLGSVFNGSKGIDESPESSDGGVDLEDSGGDGLRR